ncbi:hypothetical protein BDD12DRAFT_858024 [Trichophaea hybrida]|nr:hypothetical protein BDD12DRAFT_858024 [Trichophaea hybrida]
MKNSFSFSMPKFLPLLCLFFLCSRPQNLKVLGEHNVPSDHPAASALNSRCNHAELTSRRCIILGLISRSID